MFFVDCASASDGAKVNAADAASMVRRVIFFMSLPLMLLRSGFCFCSFIDYRSPNRAFCIPAAAG
jgi:hypothetical protein